MNRRSLLYAVFFSLLLCALVLAVIIGRVYFLRGELSKESPSIFHHVLQTDYNLDRFVQSLYAYKDTINDAEQSSDFISRYQVKFEILWSGFNVFKVRSFQSLERGQTVTLFQDKLAVYLQTYESIVVSDDGLTHDQIDLLLLEADELAKDLRRFSSAYFALSTASHDKWVYEVERLYSFFWIIAGLLVLAVVILVGFLMRSNSSANSMVESLKSAHAQLNKNIDELSAGRLENKAKDRFIAEASHDLRQPLHALGLFLGELGHFVHGSAGKKALSHASESAAELNKLLNSLLDLTRLTSGGVEVSRKKFNIDSLLELMRHEFLPLANAEGLNLEISSCNRYIVSDPIILNRIVRNLLDNAIKHGKASKVSIVVKDYSDGIMLIVRDNGCGIPTKEQTNIFSEYYQVSTSHREHSKSLGLGLAIVKQLADLLKIEITLQSVENVQTEFTLKLPLSKDAPEPVTDRESSHEPAISSSIVAVLDDDKRICAGMDTMLQNMSLRCVWATSVEEMVDKLAASAELPRLLIADYHLGGDKTGDQAIAIIREALSHDIPSLLVTGDISQVRRLTSESKNFELLCKPVEPKLLKDAIYRSLDQNTSLVH